MSYIEKERQKAIEMRDELFRDPGSGIFMGKNRDFVLIKPDLNLWAGIREDALENFKKNKISWWKSKDEPTGHMLSSQVACVNHLFPIRQRQELALAVLQSINRQFYQAEIVDDGFVEFEKVGNEKLGQERSSTRGANSTSIDAIMVGTREDGKRILVLIEWKYTESYPGNLVLVSDSGTSRLEVYKDLLENPGCPIKCNDLKDLFYEPYYQLMRQTLLGWEMVKRKEYACDDWIHVHVIPNANKELKDKVTSPGLPGNKLEVAWKSVLKSPEKYIVIDPVDLLSNLKKEKDAKSHLGYLEKRYW